MKKHISQILRERLEDYQEGGRNRVLYHGTDKPERINKEGEIFLSSDAHFSSFYGHYIYKCLADIGKVFDSNNAKDIKMIYAAGFKLMDPYINDAYKEGDDIFNYYDSVRDYYPTAELFLRAPKYGNTWEAIESTDGLIDWIFSNGFDSIAIYEEGTANYYMHTSRIVKCELIRGKKVDNSL